MVNWKVRSKNYLEIDCLKNVFCYVIFNVKKRIFLFYDPEILYNYYVHNGLCLLAGLGFYYLDG
jgi:hypothetical protein